MNKLTIEQCLDRLVKVHGNLYNYSLFTSYSGNNKLPIDIICKIHGRFKQSYANHVRDHGCPCCKRDKLSKTLKSDNKDFIIKARNVHGNKYNYDKVRYVLAQSNVEIICSSHGSFFQSPANHLKGAGCPQCKCEFLRLLFSDSLGDFIAKAEGFTATPIHTKK